MAKNILADLVLRLSANSAELTKGLDRAHNSLTNLERNTKNIGGQITGSIAKISGAFLAIGGAIDFFKKAINAVEGPGDAFASSMAGAKEALFEFQRALVTLDFNKFFSNMREAFNRGKDLEEQLDALADSNAYTRYLTSKLEVESRLLQETIKNTTLDIKVREAAAQKREDIEKQIQDIIVSEAEKTFIIEKQSWESRNKMSVERGIKLYETIRQLSAKELQALQDDYNERNKLGLKWSDGAIQIAEKVANKVMKNNEEIATNTQEAIKTFTGGPEALKKALGIPEDIYKNYNDFFELLDKGERDVIIKLFDSQSKYFNTVANAQQRYNTALKETKNLELKANKPEKVISGMNIIQPEAFKLKTDITKPLTDFRFSYEEFFKKINDITIEGSKTLGETLSTVLPNALKSLGPTLEIIIGDIKEKLKTLNDEMSNIIKMGFIDIASTFAQGIGRLAAGDTDFKIGENILSSIANFLSQLGRYMLTMAPIVKAIKTAIKSMNPALMIAGGIALLALSGIIQGGIAKRAKATNFAQGGIAYGETFARIGEYSGARTNPEVVAPLDRLKDLMGMTNPFNGEVIFRIGERELVGILTTANKKQVNF
jgi:hypothetical protein